RGARPSGSNPPEIAFWIDGKIAHKAKLSPPKSGEMNGQWAEFTTPVTAGEHWLSVTILRMYEGLTKAYKGPNPSSSQGSARTGVDAWFPMYLDVIGPYNQVTGPSEQSLGKVFVCGHAAGHHDGSCARKIVADLARRAYRRPVEDREVDELLKFVAMAQANGDSFEEGICLA